MIIGIRKYFLVYYYERESIKIAIFNERSDEQKKLLSFNKKGPIFPAQVK